MHGWGDINDNLNITLDIKVVLFSLTHAVVILMLLICALLHFLVRYVLMINHMGHNARKCPFRQIFNVTEISLI